MSENPGNVAEKKKLFGLYTAKQVVWFFIGIAVCAFFFVAQPLQFGTADALSVGGMKALGVFFCAVCWWIGAVFPEFVTAIAMMTAFVLFGICKLELAFSAFSNSALWIVIPALAIGAALSKSGLMKRIVLRILSKFKMTFSSQVAGFLVSGTAVGPLIPSAVAKVTIVEPIAHMFSKMMGYADGSKPAAGLFSAVYIAFGTIGAVFLTGTPVTLIMIGLLPAENQSVWTWMNWFIAAWPWGIVMLICSFLAIKALYKPKNEAPVSRELIQKECDQLGQMSRGERISAVVLVLAIVAWMTQSFHGIPTAVVALIAMFVLFAAKVLDKKDYRSQIGWESVTFIASVLSLASVFTTLKIPEWVGSSFGVYMAPLFSNVVVVVIMTIVCITLLRFIFVSQTALLTIFVVACIPFAQAAGIDPWIPGFCALVAVNVWNTAYMNTTFIAGMSSVSGMVKFKDVQKMSFAYVGISLLGCLACIPVWTMLGMC